LINTTQSQENQLLNGIITNSGINIFGTFFNKVSRYFSVLLVIDVLGVTGYGYYTIGLTIIGIGIIIANAGFHYGVFRFVPIFIGQDDISKVKGVINFSLKFVTISGILVASFLFLSSELIASQIYDKPELASYIKIFSLTIPFTVLSTIIINIFKGFNLIKYKVLINDFINIISRILMFLGCAVFGLGMIGITISYFLSIVFGLIIGFILMIKIIPELFDKKNMSNINRSEFFSYSTPLFLSSFFTIFLNRIDILMLSYYLAADQIGIYSIANRLAILVFFIASSTFAIFSPAIAKLLGKGQRADIEKFLYRVSKLVLIATMPIFLIIVILSKEILSIFGKEFEMGNATLLILASSFLFNSFIGFAGQVLGVMGRSKLILINSVGASFVNIFLNYILIPKYGIIGAAFATGSSIFFINVARTIEIYILENLSIINSSVIKPLFIGVTTGCIVFYLQKLLKYQLGLSYLIFFVLIILIIYFLLTWLFVFNDEDKQYLFNLAEKGKELFLSFAK
tara:strand:+ start:292 stop:1830 length:1539 start_codon:yes stop_codon:yes gene_type:complete